MNRFERQEILPGFGATGQRKLKESSILVVGAGGLGCPALLYLAAAGVGRIGIIDGDEVSLSNLNRQILFGENDLGKNKAEAAVAYFQAKYSDLVWELYPEFLSPQNAAEYIDGYDLVLDGSDNFPARYLVNDACMLLGKPWVFGAIYQHEGQVTVFNLGEDGVGYRDFYPQMPQASEIPNCSQTGVLGVLPGIIGNLMALEAIKVLTGFGKPLDKEVLFFNSLTTSTYTIELVRNPLSHTQIPSSLSALARVDYELSCEGIELIEWQEAMTAEGQLVDVREVTEKPRLDGQVLSVPLDQLTEHLEELKGFPRLLLFCQSGVRSQQAALQLKSYFPEKQIASVRGGILARNL